MELDINNGRYKVNLNEKDGVWIFDRNTYNSYINTERIEKDDMDVLLNICLDIKLNNKKAQISFSRHRLKIRYNGVLRVIRYDIYMHMLDIVEVSFV